MAAPRRGGAGRWPKLRGTALIYVPVALCVTLAAVGARAQDGGDASTREASRHFRHGVDLYAETDYVGALVEFKRAYALAPSAATLYNIGEAEYQLQDYAAALDTFRRYLASAAVSDLRRPEVEGDVQVLRTRVGRLEITTEPTGADVTVDDEPAGKTPIEEPILVSVGRRKITVTAGGRLPLVRYVDVAAGDDLRLALSLPTAEGTALAPAAPADASSPRVVAADRRTRRSTSHAIETAGWVSTGALAVGAATFGVLAIQASNRLETARSMFTTGATLAHDANVTSTYSIVADSLGAGAVVLGALSLYWTLTAPSAPAASTEARGPHASLGLGSAYFATTF